MRYQLTISYDGTHYGGWQVQKNSNAIQPLIQKALETFLRHPIDLTGSSRTDAGVHAKGQTAHFDTDLVFEPKRMILSLSALLPKDIRVLKVEPKEPSFHSRYSAKSKIYHYHLHLAPVINPFTKLYSHHVLGPIDLNLLKEAAQNLIGTHDFTAFANRGNEKEGIRTLY